MDFLLVLSSLLGRPGRQQSQHLRTETWGWGFQPLKACLSSELHLSGAPSMVPRFSQGYFCRNVSPRESVREHRPFQGDVTRGETADQQRWGARRPEFRSQLAVDYSVAPSKSLHLWPPQVALHVLPWVYCPCAVSLLVSRPERFLPLPTVTQPLRHPGQGSNAGLTPLRNELMEPKDGLRERKGSQGNPGHPPPLDSVFPIPAWPHKAPEAPGCCHPTCFLKQISISSDMPLIFSARPFLPHGPSGDISATQSC